MAALALFWRDVCQLYSTVMAQNIAEILVAIQSTTRTFNPRQRKEQGPILISRVEHLVRNAKITVLCETKKKFFSV